MLVFLMSYMPRYPPAGLPVPVWVYSGFSGFLPQAKDMQIKSIAYPKLLLGVNVSVNVSVFDLRWIGKLPRV